MAKFIINDIIIEKSDKDIKTGVKYELSQGINLICGKNEAGKSSLMKFIKEGLFRPTKTDTGKLFFSIVADNNIENYRADIKNSSKKQDRCKIYDKNDSPCDYSITESLINQKYFEQGFTINLDDLMNLQYDNNSTLVNVIKDPSGDKVNTFIQKIKANISTYIGTNNKPRISVTEIQNKISLLNTKINELSQKESKYNSAIQTIHSLDEEIKQLSDKQEYLNILLELSSTKEELERINEQCKNLKITFNEKLDEKKEQYIELLQNAGKFISNADTIRRDKDRLDANILKYTTDINRLNNEFCITPTEEDLEKFVIDYEKTSKIKELISEIENNKTEIKAFEKIIENLEDTLSRLNIDLDGLNKTNTKKYNIEELKEIYSAINDSLKQYKTLSTDISNIEKNAKLNAVNIWANKKVAILYTALFLLMVSCSVVSFYQKITSAGIFSLLMAVIIAIGFTLQKLSGYRENSANDKIRKQTQQEAILINLLEKVQNYFPEIKNIESSYLLEKLDDLKQEINTNIINTTSFNEKLLKCESDIKFNETKLSSTKEKVENLQNRNNDYSSEIKSLINTDNSSILLNEKTYLEAIVIIKNIKDEINEKNQLLSEIKKVEETNNEILKEFNSFVIENAININLSNNLNENVEALRQYFENNNETKKQIDILNISIANLENKTSKLYEAKTPFAQMFSDINENIDIKEKVIETDTLKKSKQIEKQDAIFTKRELEEFEGITDLKNERNVLLNEFRNIVKNICINKTVSEITAIAKSNFDKTQPDLINAQKYLAILTDNKYSKINLETEEIISSDGTIIKKWDELSRGTKEQLYLALRLGYASNYSKDKNTMKNNGRADLPVIIDDAFVNFDYERTHNAIKCLMDFAKTNQVLFFTCHTEMMKKHFKELNLEENENFKILYIN